MSGETWNGAVLGAQKGQREEAERRNMVKRRIVIVALLLTCSPDHQGPGNPGETTTLSAGPISARLQRSEAPLDAGASYPRRIVVEGRLGDDGDVLRQEFSLLGPPAPLPIEGLGLEVSTDTPGLNREEHAELRAWLAAQGLPADTTQFQALHQAHSGRELRVWYEISGRRISGTLSRGEGGPRLARFDSLYRRRGGPIEDPSQAHG
jgi:hypothetical protein